MSATIGYAFKTIGLLAVLFLLLMKIMYSTLSDLLHEGFGFGVSLDNAMEANEK